MIVLLAAVCVTCVLLSYTFAGAEDMQQITVRATDHGTLEYTYRVLNDIELRGIHGENQWFFHVDEDMDVADFHFRLFLRMSEMINSETSYFTVYMNDLPVTSMKLKQESHTINDNWEFDIPVQMIKQGYNELKVSTSSRIINTCEDDRNIANWVTIDGNTNYTISYVKQPRNYLISDFPKPFIGMYADDAKGIAVVVPDDYTETEIGTALTFMAYLQANSLSYEVPATLVVGDDSQLQEYDSLVYIGRIDHIPQAMTGILQKHEGSNKDQAHIYSDVWEVGSKPVLLLISDDGKRLREAVQALYNRELREQMVSDNVTLPIDIDVSLDVEIDQDYVYLNDLGINGIELHGSNQQVANIGLRIPVDYQLANEASVNLRMRYSDNLDFEKSMVTMYINGVPIGSHRLERYSRDYHSVNFYLPEKVRGAYYYDVRVVFDLIPSGTINCEQYLESAPWVYINEDSNFYLPRRQRAFISLNYLPFPFTEHEDITSVVIVIPDNPSAQDYRTAGILAQMLGAGAKGNQGNIRLVKGSEIDDTHYQENLILWGSAQNNSAIQNFNRYLWFRFADTFDKYMSNEKMELLDETAKTATIFELKVSPFANGKSILSITSPDRVALLDANEYLQKNKWAVMTGDAAVVSNQGDVTSLRFQKNAVERPDLGSSTSNITRSLQQYLVFFGMLILFLLISLGFYIYKNRKNR